MNQRKIFYLTVVFWLLIFSGFILYKEYTLRTGTEVILKTEPVDPRDLFRGDYVVLNYEISTLDLEEIPVEDPYFEYNDRIYLVLELENGYGVPKKIYRNPPDDELYIKGKVKGIEHDWETDGEGIIDETDIEKLTVEYGIESYFVPEGRGKEIESQQWTGRERVDVKVVVDKYGNAVIKSLLIDGKEVET
ncbi:putative membrane-anchored protein [Methanosarcina horonobensis HB-1 = JCM 15518]|uniref:Putative membrane-anchored protein n=1 Tax=Methanosarcina horonobensis HB-1 = JCM 15518 TaxID=1434110 RepID=A0A0E3S9L3_9EURY|nr:GDYXXLXY domain-containing protein [Methanosarcina horonobensis]AKB78269.1 putative membrane-anchored protein [Methanosarcina horonobensis HB-1 = JCM 15518]